MENKLYVSNIANETTHEQLQALFSQIGVVVRINIIVNAATGRRRGAAYIEMQSPVNIDNAIKRFDGYVLDNQVLTVREAALGQNRPTRASDDSGNRL